MIFARAIQDNTNADEAVVDDREPGASGASDREMVVGRLLLTSLVVLFIADWLFQPDKFRVEEVLVYGESADTGDGQVEKVVRNALDGNFFSVDLKRLENEVEQLPRVFSASIRRQWPSTIVVKVVEPELAARWGTDKWLGTEGDLVVRKVNEKWDHSALARLDGPEDQVEVVWQVFQQWSGKFAAVGLSLDALALSPTGLLDFRLSATAAGLRAGSDLAHVHAGDTDVNVNVVVELENSGVRVQRFLDTLGQGLLARFPRMKSIDLRYPNGFAVGWRDRATASVAGVESAGGRP